jgi:hypothetical protein
MQDNTLIAVIELGLSNWLVAGLIDAGRSLNVSGSTTTRVGLIG